MNLCYLRSPALTALLLFTIAAGSSGCQPKSSERVATGTVRGPAPGVDPGDKGDYHADPLALAIDQVLASSRSDDPFLRANAIEAAHGLHDRLRQLVHLGLEDPHDAVRFAAVATAGKFRLKSAVPMLRRLLDEPSPSDRAAALFALKRCEEPVDLSPLADMIREPDAMMRGNVAMLLGQLGDRSAVPMLKEIARLGSDPQITALEYSIVQIQIAEALVKLGDESGRDVIRAAAFSQHGEIRILAVQMLGRLNDKKYGPALVAMLPKDPVELRMAAAEALARLGDDRGLEQVLEGSRFELPVVRAQAALGLAPFRSARAAGALERMLRDPSEQVRLAAAAAIIQASGPPKQ